MIKDKLIKTMLVLLIGVILVSCGATTEREWSIENQSSSKISFRFKKHLYPYDIGGSLEKGERRIVEISSDEKADLDPQIPYDVFSEMKITNANGDVMKKEWQDNNNWEIFIEESDTRPQKQFQTYKLIVKDQDF
jgi:hypothetical protein